jgi:hypothetical protein
MGQILHVKYPIYFVEMVFFNYYCCTEYDTLSMQEKVYNVNSFTKYVVFCAKASKNVKVNVQLSLVKTMIEKEIVHSSLLIYEID